ncbi:hypothetical protein [Nonomuraea sp. SBT364]|uniref:hypothetical protein n=1 Tax=Nonomuraea sp. SBT364 TaxID=1580530 RepID=UPI00066D9248|nr:hypothetical protein [Nonomuraea sp. SBT364]
MQIALALPALLTSLFVVTAERLPFDLPALPWRVGAPYRRAAIAGAGSPSLLLTHHPSPWRPAGVTLTDAERRLLRRCGEHVVISATVPPVALPAGAQLARAVARTLAHECGGLLADPLTAATLRAAALPGDLVGQPVGRPVGQPVGQPAGRPSGEPGAFRLGDGWLGWDVRVHDDATCPPWDPADTGACHALSVTSRGLSRFALPEITLDGAACAHRLCATGLLRTVAHRLVADQLAFLATRPDTRLRLIDDHLRIEPPSPEAPLSVRLTPCETGPAEPGRTGSIRRLKIAPATGGGRVSCLRVGPPSGFTGSVNDWLCAPRPACPTPALAA